MEHNSKRRFGNEPIAIVGSACRFPGSLNSPSKLWEFLRKPKDLASKIPADRFNADAFFHPDGAHHGTSNVTESYFLDDDVRHFDASFFNIKPVEAHSIDPQHRLLLEVVYESLEASGQSIELLAGSQTGVYVGLMCADFSEHLQRDLDSIPMYMATGTARSLISNRISYFFDWHGPSMTIDTACSSSLFAVHQAVQLLRSGDSDVAVATGSNLILGPELYIGESKLKMLSPTGRSRMWDADADGYARGEGVASVILKRLSDAIRDGDHIESIIRETGINTDGRTKGLTMPSELAQSDLITRTYRKAGLDPRKEEDRCQFFEAHGTGTEAGDCREAEGISRAFLGYGSNGETPVQAQPSNLYVGSIKTVIGHTEGTAGLAGLLKASLAIQHSTIPPNMLFERLSPKVEPFYNGLEILTESKPWPRVDQVRRASVNSFGFGGANAHVILENYNPPANGVSSPLDGALAPTPFLFSAASETALEGTLEAYAAHLRSHPDLSLGDLSHTLHSRRSALGVRTAFLAGASSPEQLADQITDQLELVRTRRKDKNAAAPMGESSSLGTRPVTSAPARILGVFTGQGAQWATMGKGLIQGSAFVRNRLQTLQRALSALPESDRPSWSLVEELLADAKSSRLSEARLAQPLCTAIQVVLVDLLRAAGVEFAAVVGHSSGEIGAAYAAGVVGAEEAVRIAYYRGLCAEEYVKTEGAMLAAGTSLDDATELCALEEFVGRICVAACNSPSSVTMSGDADAVEQMKAVLEDEKKFARLLKVDTAYHSHHMEACSAPYKQALQGCGVEPRQSAAGCAWYSSVYPGTRMGVTAAQLEDLKGEYWKDNMLRPVLFAQALETAMEMNLDTPFNLVVEIGPHPALKGPASETLGALYDKIQVPRPPYTGTLQRGSDEVGALSNALGFVWIRFVGPVVNFSQYDALVTGEPASRRHVVPNLPTYKWDHDRVFWHDSRISRTLRNRKEAINPLLGRRIADGVGDEMRWRNIVRPSELPWIRGHQLQGQMIYPAAAYLSTAIESCAFLAGGRPLDSVEIQDFVIGKALVFEGSSEQAGVETLFALSGISNHGQQRISATFAFYAALGADADVLSRLASGRILVTCEDPSAPRPLAPTRAPEPVDTAEVREDAFYSSLEKIGYEYTEDFRALSNMRRKINYGSAQVRVPGHERAADAVLVHPALLDLALQSIFLAYWHPDDGSLDQLHVPTGIASVRIRTSLCRQDLDEGVHLPLESFLTENPMITNIIGGDVDVYGRDGTSPLIQIQGVRVTPLAERTPQADRQLFREHVWSPIVPDGGLAANNRATPEDFALASDLERLALYYIKKLDREIPPSQRQNLEWHHEALFDYVSHILEQTASGRQRYAKKEWLEDTWEEIAPIIDRYPDAIEIRLKRAVGENIARSVRGETQILEHMFKDNLLNRYYVEAMGLREATVFLSRTVAQIVHRYPHMDILEIGAGTGGATKAIFRDIGRAFSSYTFTDISTGFMEKAQEVFAATADKMVFKALDIEKDVVEQGYKEHSYDLIVASLVLHATKSLDKTMQATRRLLKPGGYLVLLEITSNDVSRVGFTMSGLPGWWLGREDGRRYSPCVSSARWHQVLLGAGFSGIDTITPEVDTLARPLSVIVTQALEPRVSLLREPLAHPAQSNEAAADKGDLVIIGGQSLATVILIDSFLDLVRHFGFNVTRFGSLEEVDAAAEISPTALILNVTELDKPVFQGLTSETMQGIQALVDYQRTILWVTQGCRADQPYMNMSVGLGRSLSLEKPDVRLQYFDLDFTRKAGARLVAETLLRLRFARGESATQGMLYSLEQELAEEGEYVVIPRLLPIQPANDRFNATKRTITQAKNTEECSLTLTTTDSGHHKISEAGPEHGVRLAPDEVLVHAASSTLSPIAGRMYGVIGQDRRADTWVLGLSHINGSRVTVKNAHLIRLPDTQATSDDQTGRQHQLLAVLTTEAHCNQILLATPPGGTVIVNEPSTALATRLLERAVSRNMTVTFTTPTTAPVATLPKDASIIPLSPFTSKRNVRAALTPNASLFMDCSEGGLGPLVASCLPVSCQRRSLAELVTSSEQQDHLQSAGLGFGVAETLQRAVSRLAAGGGEGATGTEARGIEFRVLTPSQLLADSLPDTSVPAILTWQAEKSVPVRLQSVDSMMRFDGSKTYVLFGLTSDLGRSVVAWMASHGGRNFVMTSRRPCIDALWLDQCRERGVRVEVFANDITDREAVENLVGEIRRTFPPIAGIMHGAMVLQDVPFPEMSFETMNKVLRPKVLGAIHLDHLFQDPSLDFFIFFSSLASASGNRGQSNYSAANMYMTAKTFERHRKGLAASVLHLGAVMGVGYVTREASETVFPAIRRAGFQWMDERAFHQCLAECILAGRPGSGRNPELVTGLRSFNVDEEEPTPWMNNPRFQHCITRGVTSADIKRDQGGAMVGVKSRLLEATTPEETLSIITEAFLQKLQVMLQIQLQSDDDRARILTANAEDTGIDSLVAVEIRSWFQKEIDIDVPVLMILGGATISDLISHAQGKLARSAGAVGINVEPAQSAEEGSESNAAATSAITQASTPPTTDPTSSSRASTGHTSVSSGNVSPSLKAETTLSSLTPFSDDNSNQFETEVKSHLQLDSPGPQSNRLQGSDFEKTAPMSLGQSRFWFLRHYLEDQTTFNITFSVKLKGALHVERFESAIQTLGQRHQALRTAFVFQGDQELPVQAILKNSLLQLEKKQIKDAREASQVYEEMKNHVFDIEGGKSMRLVLLALSPTIHFLVVGYHHINMDGASLEVFLADLTKLYNGMRLTPNPYQYPDFSVQQSLDIQRGTMQSDLAYWKTQLADSPAALPLLPFASAKRRTPIRRYDHNRVSRRIDSGLAARIRDVCRKQKASVFHFHLAVFQATLFRLLDTADLTVGMADANRFEDDLASSVGMYLNLLPLRFRLSGGQTFADALKDTRRTAYGAMAHSRVPFDLVLDTISPERSTLYSPLFQAFINYRAGVAEKRSMGALEGEGEEYHFGRTAYDVSLDILENPNSDPLLLFVVQKQLYSEKDANVLADAYMNVLDHFTREPASTLESAPPFAPASISEAMEIGRGRLADPVWPDTIVHRIDDVVHQYSDKVAVREPISGGTWTYQQFGDRTTAIARALLDANVALGARVGVFQEPGFEWVCSAMAVLRVGAVLIPLDAGTPVARLEAMVKTAKPYAVLFHSSRSSQDSEGLVAVRNGCTVAINTSETITAPTQGDTTPPALLAKPGGSAIVLFTSGTTGVPKGIALSHEGIANFLEHHSTGHPDEVVLHQSALGFDLGNWQYLSSLANGGTLAVVPRASRGDPVAITALMAKEGVTCTGATPSEYASWIQYGFVKLAQCASWRYAMAVGEPWPAKLSDEFGRLRLPGLKVWNSYGPSETTFGSSDAEVVFGASVEDSVVPVGRTMPNRSVYILDNNLRPVAAGMPGEIVIGGAGVALGYLDDEMLTKASFLPDPFAQDGFKGKGWTRMYRTGDRGFLTRDQGLVVLGRVDGDSQVKLRGIRIELQDIEQVILQHADGALANVCVTARGDPATLVAHAVFRSNSSVDEQKRSAFLHRLAASLPLPQYMQPAAVVAIPSMPLTAHGKLDRRAVQRLPIQVDNVAPSGQTTGPVQLGERELQLRRVWEQVVPQDVLSLYTVDSETDFFHIGGNSMLLVKLQDLIKQEFGAKLTIMRLFENSKLGAMSAAVHDAALENADAPIDWEEETTPGKDFIEAVPIQGSAAKSTAGGKVIILTGATGFIGRELLTQLVASPDISTVHCIAVRDPSKLADISNHPKVSIHTGDLLHPSTLTDLPKQTILDPAHALIHCAADVSFLKTYPTLRAANVTATKTLAVLARGHGIDFHYISSAATSRLLLPDPLAGPSDKQTAQGITPEQEMFRETSLASQPPPPTWPDNYIASKWASEVFLERAASITQSQGERELRVWVHRPTSVLGAGAGEMDVMATVMRFAKDMRAVPVSGRWRGALDFVRVETVAGGVVGAVVNDEKHGGLVRFSHHNGDMVVPIGGLKSHLEAEDGVVYETVGLGEWVDMAVAKGMNVLVAAYLAAVDEMDLEIVFQSYVKG